MGKEEKKPKSAPRRIGALARQKCGPDAGGKRRMEASNTQ